MLRALGEPAALIGYCLGGTMAIAAANAVPCERVATLAAPWHFGRYPDDSRAALAATWAQARASAEAPGALPMEVLQASFWALDPLRTVSKFAKFGGLDPASAPARRFVELEDWANEGEPLPFPAARELIEDLFACDLPGKRAMGPSADAPSATGSTSLCSTSPPAATASRRPRPPPMAPLSA